LRTKERENHSLKYLEKAIECAGTRHRELELSVTPKVHTTEVHAKQQWVELPFSLFWVIEQFVEHNHQIGRKYEEQVKRIKTMNEELLQKPNKYGCLSIQRCKSTSIKYGNKENEGRTRKDNI
jgi:hypothetical protein